MEVQPEREDGQPLILVIDDLPQIVGMLTQELATQGFRVMGAPVGEDAYRAIERYAPAAVLLELQLPGMHGFDVMRRIKKRYGVPVIFLTASDSEGDRQQALELGADNYVTKPYLPEDLALRLNAALQRQAHRETIHTARCGDVFIDVAHRTVTKGDAILSLSTNEWALLYTLLARPGRTATAAEMLEAVFGTDYVGEAPYLEMWMHRLRRRLGDNPERPTVITGNAERGYTLRVDEIC
jgi:DNA-binding response OmpR family regulator